MSSFRDTISTAKNGKRVWLLPKKPKGAFFDKRLLVAIGLLAFLFAAPFVKVGGQPLVLINLIQRKFILFGHLFVPQDFFILGLSMLLFFVVVIMFTSVFGRVWCGWACPQTIFMEILYRRIEYAIEGDAGQQRKLNQMPWNAEKIRKKGIKHILFIMLSFILANLFLAYLIGVDELKVLVTGGPLAHLDTFVAVVITTIVINIIYSFLREQVCVNFCPYGRLQSVLVNKSTMTVAYDYGRGEPRGKKKKKVEEAATPLGDCVDCSLCVQVCPTGIDIRNGTQMECVGCTACIDACNPVMEKLGREKGLIRYASEEEIEGGKKWEFNTRVKAYLALVTVLLSVIVYLIASRSVVEATILRAPGVMYQKTEDGNIQNLYTVQLVNKTYDTLNCALKIVEPQSGELTLVGDQTSLQLLPQGTANGAFFLVLPPKDIQGLKTPVEFELWIDNKKIESVKSGFLGPANLR